MRIFLPQSRHTECGPLVVGGCVFAVQALLGIRSEDGRNIDVYGVELDLQHQDVLHQCVLRRRKDMEAQMGAGMEADALLSRDDFEHVATYLCKRWNGVHVGRSFLLLDPVPSPSPSVCVCVCILAMAVSFPVLC